MENKIRNGLYFLVTLFLSITAIFFIIRLTPGDPIERILGEWATQNEIKEYRTQLKLDYSVGRQFLEYILGIFTGDMGVSLFKKKPVWDLLATHMPPTLILAFFSILISTPLGIVLGLISALYKSRSGDHIVRFLSLIALAFPIFSLAPLFVLIFSIKFRWLPVSGWGEIKYMIMPVVVLVVPLSAVISRVMRNKFLEENKGMWVIYLAAKGLSPISIILRVLKICLPTILNVVALQLSVVLAGTMITETIFDIPGMGILLFEGIQNRDYPVVQGVILYSTVIYMIVYFSINFLNEFIDVRLRKSSL